MIRQNIPEIVRVLAEPLDAFDIYYMHNQEQILGLLYSKGYNQNDNEGIGGLEQYDNEAYHFSDYPGETIFYHLVMVKSAINPQTKLSWFLSKIKMQADSNSQPHRVAGSPEEATSESERIGSRQTASQCVDLSKGEK